MLVTALVTPFREEGGAPDTDLYERMVRFALDEGCDQVLVAGTTGEAAAMDEVERASLVDAALRTARPEQVMVSIGGGRVPDVIARGRAALDRGVVDLLLADAPYVGAASAALREHWYAPVATALPAARLCPYAVPGRTGSELLPDDLARLAEDHANVVAVKDATGRLARMERVRALLGADFRLLCGDDALLRDAMIAPEVKADGGVSVTTNLAPRAMRALHDAAATGDAASARRCHDLLVPLFGLGCVTAEEDMELRGATLVVPQRYKNPVPVKAGLEELGVPMGTCRPPLGPMGPVGIRRVRMLLDRTARGEGSMFVPITDALGKPARHAAPELAQHAG